MAVAVRLTTHEAGAWNWNPAPWPLGRSWSWAARGVLPQPLRSVPAVKKTAAAEPARARTFSDSKRKGRARVANAKDTFSGAAETVKPYLERAMNDEKLRDELVRAFETARALYSELADERTRPVTLASRIATDDDIRDKLREAIDDLRHAGERLQGKRDRSGGRAGTILVAGIALGILFNPVTGPETRRFIRELLSGRGGRRAQRRRQLRRPSHRSIAEGAPDGGRPDRPAG